MPVITDVVSLLYQCWLEIWTGKLSSFTVICSQSI